jgi:hypothetical protein
MLPSGYVQRAPSHFVISLSLLMRLLVGLFFLLIALPVRAQVSGYRLAKPDAVLSLPDTLREISALTVLDNDHVACVQDENGIIFTYDILRNRITEQYRFGADGDYEGIAKVNDLLYVLRSDGNLFRVDKEKRTAGFISTHIPCKDSEGLFFDAITDRLWISCKKMNENSGMGKDKLPVYAVDVQTNKRDEEPFLILDVVTIQKFVLQKNLHVSSLRLRPSAIARHPLTKKIWILSATDHLLLVLNADGTPEQAELLDPLLFPQAEGITFFPNGDVLISNEAKGKTATILRFNYVAE